MITTPESLKPLLWEPKNLVRAIEAAGVALWSWNVDTDALAMDDHAYDLWGIPQNTNVTFEDLSAHIHPADRDRVRAPALALYATVSQAIPPEGASAELRAQVARFERENNEPWIAESVRQFRSGVRGGRVERIDGIHHLFLDRPDETLRAIVSFLR